LPRIVKLKSDIFLSGSRKKKGETQKNGKQSKQEGVQGPPNVGKTGSTKIQFSSPKNSPRGKVDRLGKR